jgi:hypothetical protein
MVILYNISNTVKQYKHNRTLNHTSTIPVIIFCTIDMLAGLDIVWKKIITKIVPNTQIEIVKLHSVEVENINNFVDIYMYNYLM